MIVFNIKTFIDYVKKIYPSQLNAEKANGSHDQANYLYLTFIIVTTTDFTSRGVMISALTFSIFDSCQIANHLAFYMMFTFRSLSDMQGTARIMMT